MTRILLLRHGATDVMRTHLAGRTPGIPLNQLGRAQAAALSRRIRKPDALVTSPIQRARETAQYIADIHGISQQVCDELAEFEFGAWTGLTFEELNGDPHWQRFNHARESTYAPGGESMNDVQNRSLSSLGRLVRAHPNGTVAVVSHGDVIRSLLLHAARTSIANYWRFAVDAASISELVCSEGCETIVRINDCAHLEFLTS